MTMATKRITTTSTSTRAPKVTRAGKKSPATGDAAEISARIAVRAYQRFADRGFQHGHDVEDWLAAEAELRG
jgi:hypothetical protein